MGYHCTVGLLWPSNSGVGSTLQEFEIGPVRSLKAARAVLADPGAVLKTTFPRGALILARGPASAAAAPVARIALASIVIEKGSRPGTVPIAEANVRLPRVMLDSMSIHSVTFLRDYPQSWFSVRHGPFEKFEMIAASRIVPCDTLMDFAMAEVVSAAGALGMADEVDLWIREKRSDGFPGPELKWIVERAEYLGEKRLQAFVPVLAGLTSLWRASEAILRRRPWANWAAQALVDAARARGSRGNVNVQTANVVMNAIGPFVYGFDQHMTDHNLSMAASRLMYAFNKSEVLVGLLVAGGKLIVSPKKVAL